MRIEDTEGVFHWLYTNAPAAWISAAVATITSIILIRSRKKPRRVVIRELNNSSLIRIWPGVRGKVRMTFEDRPIDGLGQIEGEIFNEGSDAIQNPTITLRLPKKSTVLAVSVSPADFEVESTIDANTVSIRLPYLNAVGDHKQVLKVSVLVDGETKPLRASGSGEGWSVRLVALANPRRVLYQSVALAFLAGLSLGGTYKYGRYIERHYGVPIDEVSWRAFFYDSPALVVLLVLFFISNRHLLPSIRRHLQG